MGKTKFQFRLGFRGFGNKGAKRADECGRGVDERRRDKRYEIPRSLLPLRHVSHTKRSDKCARFARWALAFS